MNKNESFKFQSMNATKKLTRLKENFLKGFVLTFVLFLTMNAIGQSNSLQLKNNCFNDLVRDSILSKLMDRSYVRERNTLQFYLIRQQDSTIIDYAYKNRLQAENERNYRNALRTKDSIINSNKMIIHVQKKKKTKNAIKWGLIGAAAGIVIKSLIN